MMLTLAELKEALEQVEWTEAHDMTGRCHACGITGGHRDMCRYVRVRDALQRAIEKFPTDELMLRGDAMTHPSHNILTSAFCIGYRAARQLNACAVTDTAHCAVKYLEGRRPDDEPCVVALRKAVSEEVEKGQ